MVRFLHTGDWQLGMTRHYLTPERQAEFTRDRLDAIGRLMELAAREGCAFVVVCGDVFETNQVDRQTIRRALDVVRRAAIPVYILPGNHDPLDAGSVFRSKTFAESRPANVTVLDSETPVDAAPGVQIVGAPWRSKRPLADLVSQASQGLGADPAVTRIVVAHGAVDALVPDVGDPAVISLAAAETALAEGKIHYVALGDRHSTTNVGGTGRIRYAGAPEATDYDETNPGNVLVVDMDAAGCTATPHRVGRWRFHLLHFELRCDADISLVKSRLDALQPKETSIAKLVLRGTLTLRQKATLDAMLDGERDLFGALEIWTRHTDLLVVPDDSDFTDVALPGFAAAAAARLRDAAKTGDDASRDTARDALGLLLRLARRNA